MVQHRNIRILRLNHLCRTMGSTEESLLSETGHVRCIFSINPTQTVVVVKIKVVRAWYNIIRFYKGCYRGTFHCETWFEHHVNIMTPDVMQVSVNNTVNNTNNNFVMTCSLPKLIIVCHHTLVRNHVAGCSHSVRIKVCVFLDLHHCNRGRASCATGMGDGPARTVLLVSFMFIGYMAPSLFRLLAICCLLHGKQPATSRPPNQHLDAHPAPCTDYKPKSPKTTITIL